MKTQKGYEILRRMESARFLDDMTQKELRKWISNELDCKIIVDEAELRKELGDLEKDDDLASYQYGVIKKIKEILGEE